MRSLKREIFVQVIIPIVVMALAYAGLFYTDERFYSRVSDDITALETQLEVAHLAKEQVKPISDVLKSIRHQVSSYVTSAFGIIIVVMIMITTTTGSHLIKMINTAYDEILHARGE